MLLHSINITILNNAAGLLSRFIVARNTNGWQSHQSLSPEGMLPPPKIGQSNKPKMPA